ncbi:hypothetical protein [Brevundimonas sp. ZS04]|uniref:hypothetical protein n=2 Tax=Brevundimonas TaxID=41275 RepID=UPI0011778D29|nr:hypothetical protein [Brevundimonas sp. ZS04]
MLKRMVFFAAGMEAVAEHSLMEAHVSHLLTKLLGKNPGASIAIFEGLSGAQAQAKALKRVANEALTPDDKALLFKIMDCCKAASTGRDTISHRLWLMDDQFPDAVVLYEPAAMWRLSIKSEALSDQGPISIEAAKNVQAQMRQAAQIWRMSDFDLVKRQAGKASVALVAFGEALTLGVTDAGHTKRQQIDALLKF